MNLLSVDDAECLEQTKLLLTHKQEIERPSKSLIYTVRKRLIQLYIQLNNVANDKCWACRQIHQQQTEGFDT